MDQELIYPMIEDVVLDAPFTGLKMMWDAIESLVYMYGDMRSVTVDNFDTTIQINQCDGCRRGLPLKDGIHYGDGYDMITCTKERY